MENKPLTQTIDLLKYTFVIVPIVAGTDKFVNLLTRWEQYLNPAFAAFLPISAEAFMMTVGIIEIAAGIIVLKKPTIGGYIVSAWLTAIAFTLLLGYTYVDVAVRDLVIAVAAFSLARLSKIASA